MSWNQPSTKPQPKPVKGNAKWLLPVAIVLACCMCGLLFFFCSDGEKPQDSPTRIKAPIKETSKTTAIHTETSKHNDASEDVKTEIKEEKVHHPVTEEDMVNPVNNNPNVRVVRLKPQPKKLFRQTSEELIAGLIDTQPGVMVIGEIPYHKFENDFTAAAIDKIELTDDDSDYERELKIAVEETKKAICDIMGKEGRSFADIMTEARQEQQSLAQYRLDLEDELRQIRKSGEYDADEYDKFVQAANKMLEAKGAAPLKTPGVYYRQLKLNQIKKGQNEHQL